MFALTVAGDGVAAVEFLFCFLCSIKRHADRLTAAKKSSERDNKQVFHHRILN